MDSSNCCQIAVRIAVRLHNVAGPEGCFVFRKWCCARQESNLLPCGPEPDQAPLRSHSPYSNQYCPVSSFGALLQARCYNRCYRAKVAIIVTDPPTADLIRQGPVDPANRPHATEAELKQSTEVARNLAAWSVSWAVGVE